MYDGYPPRITVGDLCIAPQALRVWRDGRPVPLSLREFQTLLALVSTPGRVWTRPEILRFCGSCGRRASRAVDLRTVDVWVAMLRRRLGHDVITTIRGVGYRWDAIGRMPIALPSQTQGQ